MSRIAILGFLIGGACSSFALACEPATGLLRHPARGEIDKRFGYVQHPILHTTRLHTGIDYKGAIGDPIAVSDNGAVVEAKVEGAYGNYVRIDHGAGRQTAYAHLQKIEVKVGDCVRQSQIIGHIGSTGLATAPHLHFEILQSGRFLDPAPLLPARD